MKRIDAWRLREELREHPVAPLRLRHCGSMRYQTKVQLLTAGGDVAWWNGVVCCRSRVCPPCFVARRFKAANEINHTVDERHRETGMQSFLVTLTVRHQADDPVTLTRSVRAAWRDMLQSRQWRTFAKGYGVEWIVAEEVTRGDNGWHPHLHALLMPRRSIGEVYGDGWPAWLQGQNVTENMIRCQWERSVRRRIGEQHAPDARYGVDLTPCNAADYITKLGLELTDPALVKGRSPLALLAAGERDLYMQLQQSRTRARDITFSRGLGGIRESLPVGEPPAELLELVGSDWFVLRSRGWDKPLQVAEAAKDPETAAAAFTAATGRRREPCAKS